MLADRATILNRVAAGQMTAEEAARALSRPAAGPSADQLERLKGRWLHIRVTRLSTGAARATINLPLTWVAIGMHIGARFEHRIAGVDWAEVTELINSGADGRLVEVENLDDDERVEITVE